MILVQVIIRVMSLLVLVLVFRRVGIREELVLVKVVHQDSDCFETKKCWQSLAHFAEQAFVMSLSANLASELQGIDHLLLPLPDFLERCPSL